MALRPEILFCLPILLLLWPTIPASPLSIDPFPRDSNYTTSLGHRITAPTLTLTAHFLRNGALEPLSVETRSVRSRNSATDQTNILHDGWSWMPRNNVVEKLVSSLHRSCFVPDATRGANATAAGDENGPALACARAYLRDDVEGDAAGVRSTIEAYLVGHLPPEVSASCSPVSGRGGGWTLFSRRSDDPQNMHYDAVDAERDADCSALELRPESVATNVRVWMPLAAVVDAPLLLANTTRLYDDACPKRAGDDGSMKMPAFGKEAAVKSSAAIRNGRGLLSPSWRIYSRHEFVMDCQAKQEQEQDGHGNDYAHSYVGSDIDIDSDGENGPCNFFHTVGMVPGEAIIFRNGMVMHGTANYGNGRRTSLAMDCVTFPSKTTKESN